MAPADTRITFFSKTFLVHSNLLKAHSQKFRELCEAYDEEDTNSARLFRYEWNLMINPRGVWRIGSTKSVQAPSQAECDAYKDDAGNGYIAMETGFDRLMHVFHGHAFCFAELVFHMNYIIPIVEIAQFLQAIPALSIPMTREIRRHQGDQFKKAVERMATDTKFALNMLKISTQLQIPELFRDALMICIGPYHNSFFTRGLEYTTSEKLKETATAVFEELQTRERVQQADIDDWMEKDYDSYVGAMELPSEEIKKANDKANAALLREDRDRPADLCVGGVSKPAYYRRLSKVATPNYPGFFKTVLGPLLENKLTMYPAARAGEGVFKHHFLCARIKEKHLPWSKGTDTDEDSEGKKDSVAARVVEDGD